MVLNSLSVARDTYSKGNTYFEVVCQPTSPFLHSHLPSRSDLFECREFVVGRNERRIAVHFRLFKLQARSLALLSMWQRS